MSHDNNVAGRGAAGGGGYGATSDLGHGAGGSDYGHGAGVSALNPIPDHDFTAGASLAPVGGYADLARGPSLVRGVSPQPQMHENLTRGPSMNRAAYDQSYGVPLHHQGGSYGAADAYDYNGAAVRY